MLMLKRVGFSKEISVLNTIPLVSAFDILELTKEILSLSEIAFIPNSLKAERDNILTSPIFKSLFMISATIKITYCIDTKLCHISHNCRNTGIHRHLQKRLKRNNIQEKISRKHFTYSTKNS